MTRSPAGSSLLLPKILGLEAWNQVQVTPAESEDLVCELMKDGEPYPIGSRRYWIETTLKDPAKSARDENNVKYRTMRADPIAGKAGLFVIDPSAHQGGECIIEAAFVDERRAPGPGGESARILVHFKGPAYFAQVFDERIPYGRPADDGLTWSRSQSGAEEQRIQANIEIDATENEPGERHSMEIVMRLEPHSR